jgi:hypothetical protein
MSKKLPSNSHGNLARRPERAGAFFSALAAIIGLQLWSAEGGADTGSLPEGVREFWLEGERKLGEFRKVEDLYIPFVPLDVTDAHLKLLRKSRLVWDRLERGAPKLDPKMPYGRKDLMAQLGETFAGETPLQLAARHVEMAIVLVKLQRNGQIKPGDYQIKNLSLDVIRKGMKGYGPAGGLSDGDLGFLADGRFRLTDEHIKLARAMQVQFSDYYDNEDRYDSGVYPAATFDAKRCYGEMTFIELDMARVLGLLPAPAADGSPVKPDTEVQERLARLHLQMLGAMQVFVENAELAPGHYD